MESGIPGYLRYRIIDQNTGAVLVDDLPHTHQSKWSVRALQQGLPGASLIGDFSITLFSPMSDEFLAASSDYMLISIGNKVEAYLYDIVAHTDTNVAAIDIEPRFTGVITDINRSLKGNWTITGKDTLFWLEQSQMLPEEIFAGPLAGVLPTPCTDIVRMLLCTQEIVWTDDFANWNSGSIHPNSSDYAISGGWAFTSSDPFEGLPALGNTTTTDDQNVLTTTSWNRSSQYTFAQITVWGTCSINTGGTNTILPGIFFLSDAGNNNAILCEVFMGWNATFSLFDVTAVIFSKSAGVYTQQATAQVFVGANGVRSPFTFELGAILYSNAGKNEVRITINGQDSGCIWSGGIWPSSGRIGLRHGLSGAVTNSIYINRIQFKARTRVPGPTDWTPPRFKEGNIDTGTGTIINEINTNNQTHLDMMLLASGTDGFFLSKVPGQGNKGDAINYRSAANAGVDFSSSIVFDEAINIVDAEVAPISELYATDIKVNGIPGRNTGGNVSWTKIGSTGDMVLNDTVSDVGIPEARLLLAYAKIVQSRKSNPLQATQVTVIRTSDTADKWKELDYVTVNIPRLGIYNRKSLIVGYDFTEGADTEVIYFDQFPDSAVPAFNTQRFHGPIDFLTGTYQKR